MDILFISVCLSCRLGVIRGVSLSSVSKESIVDVAGVLRGTAVPIESCSQQNVEIHVEQVSNVQGEGDN